MSGQLHDHFVFLSVIFMTPQLKRSLGIYELLRFTPHVGIPVNQTPL